VGKHVQQSSIPNVELGTTDLESRNETISDNKRENSPSARDDYVRL